MTHDDEPDATLTQSSSTSIEHRQSDTSNDDCNAVVVCRQAVSAGTRPWTRSVDYLEAVNAQAAEADRVGVVPCFDDLIRQWIGSAILNLA